MARQPPRKSRGPTGRGGLAARTINHGKVLAQRAVNLQLASIAMGQTRALSPRGINAIGSAQQLYFKNAKPVGPYPACKNAPNNYSSCPSEVS